MSKITPIVPISTLQNRKAKQQKTKEDFKRLLNRDGPDGCA